MEEFELYTLTQVAMIAAVSIIYRSLDEEYILVTSYSMKSCVDRTEGTRELFSGKNII